MKLLSRLFLLPVVLIAALVMSSVNVYAAAQDGVNWETSTITVTGMGVAPPNAINAVQARLLARRAAQADAYRQLAELVKGVSVDSATTVENYMVTSDVTQTKVDAVIHGARIVSENAIPGGGYEMTMSMPMFGDSNSLAQAVLPPTVQRESFPEPVSSVAPSLPAYDSSASVSVRIDVAANKPAVSAPDSKAQGGYTGLVVDCRGLGLKPVMSPVIKNANGEKIYGHKNINPDYVIAHGMVGYTKDINNVSRAGSNPLVVRAVSLQDHNGNPVLSVADANRVLIENKATGFLEKTNVVFIR